MNTVWKINLYHVRKKTGFRVKISGNPRIASPWVYAQGDGNTPARALQAAVDEMAPSDQASIELLIGTQPAPSSGE